MKIKHLFLSLLIFSLQACVTCPKESFPAIYLSFINQPTNSTISIIQYSGQSIDTILVQENPFSIDGYAVKYEIYLKDNNGSLIRTDSIQNIELLSYGRCNHLNEVVSFNYNELLQIGSQLEISY